MRRVLLICVLGFVAGCSRTEYVVSMKPAGEGLHRVTTVRESKAIVAVDERLPPSRKLHDGRFVGHVPEDIGGKGSFTRWDTPMGSASLYLERFRGETDLAQQLQTIREMVDGLTDKLIAWFGHELKAEPKWPKLKQFLDEQFRRDLHVIALRLWHARSQSQGAFDKERVANTTAWILQYLLEQGYAEPQRMPQLSRLVNEDGLNRLAQRLLADRLVGRDQPIPPSLGFLDDDRAEESLQAWWRTTDEHARLKAELQDAERQTPEAVPADHPLLGGDLLVALIGDEFFGHSDVVHAELELPVEPVWTNGTWDAERRTVAWERRIDLPLSAPVVSTATWAEPDEAFQRERFGKVVLDGEELVSYVTWHAALTREETSQWMEFVISLKPGEDLPEKLRQFRFQGETDASHADVAVRLIVAGLEEDE